MLVSLTSCSNSGLLSPWLSLSLSASGAGGAAACCAWHAVASHGDVVEPSLQHGGVSELHQPWGCEQPQVSAAGGAGAAG